MLTAGIVLALTYVGIIFTRLPRVNVDRPAAALTGGVLMVLLGVLTFDDAVRAIDFNTIALLLGMMLLTAVLQRAGVFEALAAHAVAVATTPKRLMMVVILATAVFSALLVNDVVVLLITPIVIRASRLLGARPVPFLIVEAMASNIGSTATMVGNPQNMLIDLSSGVSFLRFFLHLAPVAIVSTAILLGVALWYFRRELASSERGAGAATLSPAAIAAPSAKLQARTLAVLGLVVAGFFTSRSVGVGVPLVALAGGVAAMLLSGVKPSDVIGSVDWVLLVFFAGLFVVVGGARQAGVLDPFVDGINLSPSVDGIVSVHVFSAVVSQIVSNVPLTMLAIPVIEGVPGDTLWMSLAAGSTLGGNATIIGAVANIIVVEQAHRQGVEVKFGEFAKLGVPVTVLTIAASIAVLGVERWMGVLR